MRVCVYAQLATLLAGGYSDRVSSHMVLDCRFGYEFEGGHVAGAHSLPCTDQLAGILFTPAMLAAHSAAREGTRPLVLVFHCEYSQSRAPAM